VVPSGNPIRAWPTPHAADSQIMESSKSRFLVPLAVFAATLAVGCSHPHGSISEQSAEPGVSAQTKNSQPSTAPLLTYSIIKDESEDSRLHSLVRLHLLVKGKITRQGLSNLLQKAYKERRLGPFKYHPDDPDIFLFAYTDKKKADSGMGLWIAILSSDAGAEPKLNYTEGELATVGNPPETKFGLTEARRKQLIWDVTACQDKAQSDAEKRFPNDVMKQADWSTSHDESCIDRMCKRYRVTRDNYYKIVVEANQKNWPLPPNKR
jgi:hypothetical protein